MGLLWTTGIKVQSETSRSLAIGLFGVLELLYSGILKQPLIKCSCMKFKKMIVIIIKID